MNTTPLPLSERLAGFAALLREHGMRVGPAEQRDMLATSLHLGSLDMGRLARHCLQQRARLAAVAGGVRAVLAAAPHQRHGQGQRPDPAPA
jgi:uncharacterized protein with von Willebrand factor type A (vWA) domain